MLSLFDKLNQGYYLRISRVGMRLRAGVQIFISLLCPQPGACRSDILINN